MDDLLQSIADKFDSFLSFFSLDNIYNLIQSMFSGFISFIFNFLFVDLKNSFISWGSKIVNVFYSDFGTKSFSFDFLSYFFGFIFVLFAFKLLLRVIRG